jgi:hypothetical protein
VVNLDSLFGQLDEAYKKGDTVEINRINQEIMSSLGNHVTESSVDYDFIRNIEGKPVYKTLSKFIGGDSLDEREVAKLLSSLVTHMIIESTVSDKDIKNYPVRSFINSIDKLIYDREGVQLDDIRKFLQERYSRFL